MITLITSLKSWSKAILPDLTANESAASARTDPKPIYGQQSGKGAQAMRGEVARHTALSKI